VIVDGATATILDYKTGNRKLDNDQLKLFALLGFIHFPQVDEIKTGYIWLKSGKLDTEVYQRGQAKELWPEVYSPSRADASRVRECEVA